jgi:hypothetical protein
MNTLQLTVYISPFPKKRLGKDYDGGYIIAEIPDIQYETFLAGGIHDDISFEEDFIAKYENVKCYAFDGSIPILPKPNDKIQFICKNIGGSNNESLTNIHDIIDNTERIFVKMDIEGGEIPWITSLSEDQLNKFEQIVMEFHYPFSEKEGVVFDKINKNHALIHFHANNCCGVRTHENVVVPNIFECTYIHRRHLKEPLELNVDPIPSELDMKNVLHNEEIYLSRHPFVHT